MTRPALILILVTVRDAGGREINRTNVTAFVGAETRTTDPLTR